jgi:hypothetical protein
MNTRLNPKEINNPPLLYPWKEVTAPIAEANNEKLVNKGQGDLSTK